MVQNKMTNQKRSIIESEISQLTVNYLLGFLEERIIENLEFESVFNELHGNEISCKQLSLIIRVLSDKDTSNDNGLKVQHERITNNTILYINEVEILEDTENVLRLLKEYVYDNYGELLKHIKV
jgi:hypothetical protein